MDESADALLLERYLLRQDESAFAALVERHGSMVWGVCRRVAKDAHAAEDAFQATWLVLARKARSLRDGNSLPGWLHRVAFRLAMATRVRPSAPLHDMAGETSNPLDNAASDEACRVIDEEVERLPEKYRMPVVLCFFQGRSHAEAAAELGWPVGTVAGRLARAKDLLHARLTRRGLAPVWPLPLVAAGAVPAVAVKATGTAGALTAALLAGESHRRMLLGGAILLLCLGATAIALVAFRPSRPPSAPEPVGPEGERSDARIFRPLMTHEKNVYSVAYSPDGRTLASASEDGTVKLWDPTTHHERFTLKGHSSSVCFVAFSPDGKTLASASFDRMIKLWDVETGAEKKTLKELREGRTVGLSFSPNGRVLVSVSEPIHGFLEDRSVKLWDVDAGTEKFAIPSQWESVERASFSPDGGTLVTVAIASGTASKQCRLWSVATGKEVVPLESFKGRISCAAYSPDGKTLALGCGGGPTSLPIQLVDVTTGKLRATFEGHTDAVVHLVFSPDGRTLASAGVDRVLTLAEQSQRAGKTISIYNSHDFKTVRLWDLGTGEERVTLNLPDKAGQALAFSPDGESLLTGGYRLWDAHAGRELGTLDGCRENDGHRRDDAPTPAWHPDGKTLAAPAADTVMLWDAKTGQAKSMLFIRRNEAPAVPISVTHSPDGQTFATGNSDGTVTLWDADRGKERATFKGHQQRINCVAFSPDGRLLASGSSDQSIRLWEVKTGQEKAVLTGIQHGVQSLAFSPDGRTLACTCGDQKMGIQLWDVKKGLQKQTLLTKDTEETDFSGVSSVAFSPDGDRLAAAGPGRWITLWDANDGTMKTRFAGGTTVRVPARREVPDQWGGPFGNKDTELTSRPQVVIWGPDGNTLASISRGGPGECNKTIRLWNLKTGEQLPLTGHLDVVQAVAFSPDGTMLASGGAGEERTIRLWDARSGKELQVLKGAGGVTALSFSPDGKTLVSVGWDGAVRLWK